MNKPSAILSGDWHLREDQPTCRVDNFEEEQWRNVNQVKALQEKYDCPVILSGDLFHHWKPSPSLLSKTIEHFPKRVCTVLGNHCVPQHNLDLLHKSGVYTLSKAEKLSILAGTHWGEKPNKVDGYVFNYGEEEERTMLIWHVMTHVGNIPWPGYDGTNADVLLKKYADYDMILTGNNHLPFTITHKGRRLLNPGSLTRQTADQIDYKPAVWLWYADTNDVTRVPLVINNNAVSREHIERQQQRDGRIEAFVSHINNDWKANVSFENNLEKAIKKNKVKKKVKNLIYKSLENDRTK